jgi:hypothetical protein
MSWPAPWTALQPVNEADKDKTTNINNKYFFISFSCFDLKGL